MYALSLLPERPEVLARSAEVWLDAALAAAAALHTLDNRLFPSSGAAEDFDFAHRLRDEWRRWADDARRVFELTRGADAAKRRELSMHLAASRIVARTSTEEHYRKYQKAMAEYEAGNYYTAEDMRRELLDARNGRRDGKVPAAEHSLAGGRA